MRQGGTSLLHQKKAVRSGYDMDILPPDLVTFSKDAKTLLEDLQSRNERMFLLTFLIDKQRTSENVYFLDAVTEKDLLSLAQSEKEPETVEPEPEPTPAPQEPADEPEPAPVPEPEKKDSPIGTILLVLAVAAIGGGAGWYFKIYRPKHQAPDLDEEEIDFEEEGDEPDGDSDLPPWDEDEPEEGDEPGKEDEE